KAEAAVNDQTKQFLGMNGKRTVDSFHKELGKIMWEYCGMARNEAGLKKAIQRIPELREEFWKNVKVPGSGEALNMELEKAGRVADFLEFGELTCRDALDRNESCGGHFREEYQTEDGEAKRNDDKYCYVAAWEHNGKSEPKLNKEPLVYENIHLATRSYK
ncbi:MAG: fumarate reductase/succinate dehydrogenase flavoprotein subunit, partial [Leptospirales bacterium]|nr:fumarate reductase/succinate dehydrogenase flavoprotein subunit [Leptospirales bacterium]